MSLKTKIYFSLFLFCSSLSLLAQTREVVLLQMEDVEGRWLEESKSGQNSIYIFKGDSTFFRAVDDQEILLFNVSGAFRLYDDTMRIVYQDLSASNIIAPARVRKMFLKALFVSEDELCFQKTDRNVTSFMRLRRQGRP